MLFWVLALLSVAVWGIQWTFSRRVVLWELGLGAGAALLLAAFFHSLVIGGAFVPTTYETHSGSVIEAIHVPEWRERYEKAIYKQERYRSGTDSNGGPVYSYRRVFSHYETRHETHSPEWVLKTNGVGTFRVDAKRYGDVVQRFGRETKYKGSRTTSKRRSKMVGGDPYNYKAENVADYVYPVTTKRKFENRLLVAASIYSYTPLSDEESKGLFPWPDNDNPFESERLLGLAPQFWDIHEWDQMNAVLGPEKRVNLIAVGYGSESSLQDAHLLERHWAGGRKNDLVLCFGGDSSNRWAYVFGWTESETVKRLLENRLREGEATIEEISRLVRNEYELLDFEEHFEHVEVPVPFAYYLIYALLVVAAQVGLHYVAQTNEDQKERI